MSPGLKKRLLVVAAILVVGVVAATAAFPLWFPWLLRPLADRYGLEYSRYERAGWQWFRLQDVRFSAANVELRARQFAARQPLSWLWHRFTGNAADPFLRIIGWELDAAAQTQPVRSDGQIDKEQPPAQQPSVYQTFATLRQTLARVEHWLPHARLEEGVVSTGSQSVQVPWAVWKAGDLTGELALPKVGHTASVQAQLGDAAPYRLRVTSESLSMEARLEVRQGPDLLNLQAQGAWLTNRIEAEAQFAPSDQLPSRASLQARSFSVPASLLHLDGYQDLEGNLRAVWNAQGFRIDLSAEALPTSSAALPAVAAEVHAGGDLNSAVLEQVRVRAPGIELHLTESTSLIFEQPFLQEETMLRLAIDLARQAWFDAQGRVDGELTVWPGAPYPEAALRLSGDGLRIADVDIKTLAVVAQWKFPWLHLVDADLSLADGSVASAGGDLDVEKRLLRDALLQMQGPFRGPWLPPDTSFRSAYLEVQAAGPLTNLVHSGLLEVHQAVGPPIQPLNLEAAWRGQQRQVQWLQANAAAGQSLFRAEGALEWQGAARTLHLTSLLLQTNGQPVLQLAQPAQITVFPPAAPPEDWQVRVQPLRWQGGERELSVDGAISWPSQGHLQTSIRNLEAGLFADFHTFTLPPIRLENLQLGAGWTNGPVAFDAALAGSVWLTNEWVARAEARVQGSGRGMNLQRFSLSEGGEALLSGQGFLPLALHLHTPTNRVQFQRNAPLQAQLTTRPHEGVWELLSARFGMGLKQPFVQASLNGTWAEPQGSIDAEVTALALPKTFADLPELENVRLRIILNRHDLILDQLGFQVHEQPVLLTGLVPLSDGLWTALQETNWHHAINWRRASARLRIEQADLEPLARHFPDLLSPQGRLAADVAVLPGARLAGRISVENVSTRPLPSVGPVRDLHLQLRLDGQQVEVESLEATLGGRPIRFAGTILLPEDLWSVQSLPAFQLHLRSANLPITRKAEMIVRADLDLALTNAPAEPPPILTGTVFLTNSYYLSDLSTLVPGKVAAPAQRPPYFSVEAKPFDQWRLNLRVLGDQFLTVRSPVFEGKISTTLRIAGTLGEPVALGEVRIDSGAIRFPFAAFQVTEGLVSLTSESPHDPQLFITATAERLDYDLRLEVTGSASDPRLHFSSMPPLSPEQILLFVTTGQTPTQAGRLSSGQRVQRLGLFLGRNLLSSVGLGGESEDRLSVRVGEEVTEDGRPSYEVEYKLTDDWSVVGEYDRFNDFNMGLKWNVLSR